MAKQVKQEPEVIDCKNLLALDLGTISTGYAWFVDGKLKEHGTIKAKDKDPWDRIHKIKEELNFLEFYHFKFTLVIENPFIHAKNAQGRLVTFALHGVIRELFYGNNIYGIDNKTWKKVVTGDGNATPAQYKAYIDMQYEPTASEDEAAAIGVGAGFLMTEGNARGANPYAD